MYVVLCNNMYIILRILFMYVQSNLVNSKSSELDVLFRITSISSYMEVDIRYITPQND